MTETLLIRHAHTAAIGRLLAGRTAGVLLDAAGVREAAALRAALRTECLAAIYTSPLERARETAAAIASGCSLEPVPDAAFNEVDYGEWTGRSIAELRSLPEWELYHSSRASIRIPGGELLREVQARALAGLDALVVRHAGARIAVVTHADVIRCVLAACLSVPLDEALGIEIAPASVSRVRWQDDGPVVLSISEAVQLPLDPIPDSQAR